MSGATRETIIASVLDYVAAWNEPDAVARLKILERCWAECASYVDPNVELSGSTALSDHISNVQAGRPGARIEMMSGVDLHHNVVRFLWGWFAPMEVLATRRSISAKPMQVAG
jgi:hypothetical protein